VRYLDDQLLQLWNQLQRNRMLENTLVIILADHGETIGERGFLDHGHNLYQEQVRIPLIVLMPGKPAGTVQQEVQIVDVFPTIMQYLKIQSSGNIQGKSLMPLIDHTSAASRPVLAELDVDYHPRFKAFRRAQRMILEGQDKYISSSRNQLLFDLKNDPMEMVNTFQTRLETASALHKQLENYFKQWHKMPGSKSGTDVDEETKRKLRALGYIE
jgi:arylsulfatase A-like enzyme